MAGVPSTSVDRARLEEGVAVADLLVETGLLASKKEARRKIEQGGVSVNREPVADARASVSLADLDGEQILLTVGKKTHHRVVPA
jgi:tyrosyl-tRNA synthetase